jgi:endoglucanase
MALGCAGLAFGCAQDPDGSFPVDGIGGIGGITGPIVPVGPPMRGLHVVGNHIENSDGATVHLRGVNRSGTEYQCMKGGALIFDGPATLAAIGTMATWKVNAVRIPLNEACWLRINGAVEASSGDNYKRAIVGYVNLLHMYNIVPILDLHWVGPGTALADRLQPMPDADHSPTFWADVARTFADDDGVIFELFNEPFPDGNRDSAAGWTCWRDGCTASLRGQAGMTYQATGMQSLVDAIRATGSRHLLLIGGLQYSNALSQWLAYAPVDSATNTAAAWHVYSFNSCSNATCWDAAPATLAQAVPIVATEIGQNDCNGTFIEPLLQWYDAHGIGYLAWTWNTWGACVPAQPMMPGQPWALISNYATGTPTSNYAQTFRDHLLGF